MARNEMTMDDRVARLVEIKEEMLELLRETQSLLRGTGEEERARSYWYAHIRMALDDDHSYLGGSMCTLQDSIDALETETNDMEHGS